MKTKNLFLSVAATMLIGFGSLANAAVLSDFQYTGSVTVTDFAATDTLAHPGDLDLRFTWTINAGSHSVTHAMGALTTAIGSGTIFGGPGLGNIAIDTGFLAPLAELIPEGTVNFPTGIPSTTALTGTPIFTTSIFTIIPLTPTFALTIDSILEVNSFNFTNNVITMDLHENVQAGGTSFGELLAGASPDGIFTRDFELSGQVSAVPVPTAVWLFGTALLGLAGARRKIA
jgi:hypothetical protein